MTALLEQRSAMRVHTAADSALPRSVLLLDNPSVGARMVRAFRAIDAVHAQALANGAPARFLRAASATDAVEAVAVKGTAN